MANAKNVKQAAASGKRATTPVAARPAKAGTAAGVKPIAKAGAASKTAPKTTPKAAPRTTPGAEPKAAAKAAVAKPSRPRAKKVAVATEQRRNYIEVAAYHIAERRGFAPGDPLQDWVQAEAEIDRLIAEGLLGG